MFREWRKEWATYFLTTENTEFTEIFKGFLSVLPAHASQLEQVCAFCGKEIL